ncbi:hypothetical protein [Enterovibrio norvegicus]|uniref:hypothetical protein n=1 Tax=Enterovibrio norvegicus TaxID=188144 RepID=UPI0018E40732|nr:hypothetical protein [Enterovibrio norvegicus]
MDGEEVPRCNLRREKREERREKREERREKKEYGNEETRKRPADAGLSADITVSG